MNRVKFKSMPKFFEKEVSGLKPNTVRKSYFGSDRDYADEERFEKLDDFISWYITPLEILIENTETGEVFGRNIKDVSKYDGLYIISWIHPKTEGS